MPRIEYKLREFPELVMLKLQSNNPRLLLGKTVAQVFGQVLQFWNQPVSAGNGLTMPGIIILVAGVMLVIAMTVLIVLQRHKFPYRAQISSLE